ncbi:MAG: protein translocase subunit SecD [Planctomycetota bacterium]
MLSPKMLTFITFAATVGAYLLGAMIGKQLKLKDQAWKLGLIFGSLVFAGMICTFVPPKAGIDLRGGVILVYEVDTEKTRELEELQGQDDQTGAPAINLDTLISALSRRINPGGQKEVVIRKYGSKQVEIIVPEVDEAEISRLKKRIAETGFLKFRIIAHRQRHARSWAAGEDALNSEDPAVRGARYVKDGDDIVGEWISIGRESGENGEPGELRFPVTPAMLTRELRPGQIELLAVVDKDLDVQGKHLSSVRSDFDSNGQPAVGFTMTSEGSVLFGQLTTANRPDEQTGISSRLGIVLDEAMLSAPEIEETIVGQGIIRGRFTQAEVEDLVSILRAGKLPAVLQREPISESRISPLLGVDTIRKGTVAIVSSLIAVLVFMSLYYRFAGLVACMALLSNLVLIFGVMILIKAAFTLPGIAGLVLTVGMSVDANVLIFERIREELNRGAALRMAIRNGFGRATTTIVDANITTLITAFILYAIGTEQIRGFAITLIIGIAMSLYTAIFCSRVIFDIAERKGWIKGLPMARVVGDTHISFIGKRHVAALVSAVCILIGMGAVFTRGTKMLDIDFNGGSSVLVMLDRSTPIDEVRSRVSDIADSVSVTQVNPEGRDPDTVYKIDSSLKDKEELQDKVKAALSDDGETFLVTRSMEFTPVAEKPAGGDSLGSLAQDRVLLAYAQDAAQEADALEVNAEVDESFDEADEDVPASLDMTVQEELQTSDGDTAAEVASPYLSAFDLKFDEKISSKVLADEIKAAAESLGLSPPAMEASHPEWDGGSERPFDQWQVKLSSDEATATRIFETLKSQLAEIPVWLSAEKIGSQVAGDMRTKAVFAVLLSLIGIVLYIWIRFQRVSYGLAAVVALVHDVLVTLGALALSYWLSGFFMIEEFKISLPIVAAFLTIIGYSLNDTIVVFDRVREVRGKSPELTKEMLDTSINQTLGRTLLTSLTTLIVVAILYIWGGQGIHGFAFALLIGVIVGTYSSIFVACPTLLWMSNLGEASDRPTNKSGKRVPAGAR